MTDKFVLDSSVWIAMEKQNQVVMRRVLPLFEKDQVVMVDVIMAEVLRGTKSKKDYEALQRAFLDFPCFHTEWIKVADLAFRVAKKGFHPPLIDLYIAQCVWKHHLSLMTLDKDFAQIAKVQKFKFELLTRN